MRTGRIAVFILLSLILAIMTACNSANGDIATQPVSPLPSSPLVPTETRPLVVPTPEAGTGAAHGVLSFVNFPLPLDGTELYLADIMTSDDGEFTNYYFDQTRNPQAEWLDPAVGIFLFNNVEPGEYALVLWWDISSYFPVISSETMEDVRVVISADEINNLGEIRSTQ